MKIDQLDTPILILDKARLTRNIDATSERISAGQDLAAAARWLALAARALHRLGPR